MKQDEKYIKRCIKLAEKSFKNGDAPFGSIVVLGNKIVAQSENWTIRKKNVTRHAEMEVILKTQKKLSPFKISQCTIYSNCEPCPMCAFILRELKFKRVVYALKSPYMGGHSKWNILRDSELEKFTPVFSKPPDVIMGVLKGKAMIIFKKAGWGKMFKPKKKSTNS